MKVKPDSRKKVEAARHKLEGGNLIDALAEVESVLKLDETNADALSLKDQILAARELQARSAVQQGLAESEKIVDLNHRVSRLQQLAAEYRGNGRVAAMLSLAEAKRDVYQVRRGRAQVFEQQNELDEALREYAQLSRLFPEDTKLADDITRVKKARHDLTSGAGTGVKTPAPEFPAAVNNNDSIGQTPMHPVTQPVLPSKQTDRTPIVATTPEAVTPPATTVAAPVPPAGVATPPERLIPTPPANKGRSLLPYGAAAMIALVVVAGLIYWKARGAAEQALNQEAPAAPATASAPSPAASVEPTGPAARIDTNLPAAQYQIDGGTAQSLEGGQATLNDLKPGRHVITIKDQKAGEAVYEFEIAATDPPKIAAVKATREITAFAVSSFEGKGKLYSSRSGLPVKQDGASNLGTTTTDGVAFSGQPGAPLPLVAGSGDQQWQLSAANLKRPAVEIFARINTSLGAFSVSVDEDNVVLKLDGKTLSAKVKKGEMRSIPNIEPGKHELRAEKPGFRADPPSARFVIAAGKQPHVEFRFTPALTIDVKGAAPGAHVLVNGREFGRVGSDGSGTIAATGVNGSCRIELKLEGYEHSPVDKNCTAGGTVSLSGNEAAMSQTNGYLAITVQPSGAKIVVQKAGETERVIQPPGGHLAPGTYTIRVSAAGFDDVVMPGVVISKNKQNSVGEVALKKK